MKTKKEMISELVKANVLDNYSPKELREISYDNIVDIYKNNIVNSNIEVEVLFFVRCYPSRTIAKAKLIKSNAKCYITELLKPNFVSFPFNKEYKEVESFDEMRRIVEETGYRDCMIKTASLSGKSRYFVHN